MVEGALTFKKNPLQHNNRSKQGNQKENMVSKMEDDDHGISRATEDKDRITTPKKLHTPKSNNKIAKSSATKRTPSAHNNALLFTSPTRSATSSSSKKKRKTPCSSTCVGGGNSSSSSRYLNKMAQHVRDQVQRKLQLDDYDMLCQEEDGTVKLITGESVLDREGQEVKLNHNLPLSDLQRNYIMHIKGRKVVGGDGIMEQLSKFSL